MKYITLLAIAITLAACSGPAPSAQDVAAYASAAHTIIHGGLQDYKAIKELQDGTP